MISFHLQFAFATLALAAALNIASFSAPYWAQSDSERLQHYGLWKHCTRKECVNNAYDTSPSWLRVVQTFESLSLLATVLGALVSLLWVCTASCNRSPRILAAVFLGAVLAVIETLVVLSVFGANFSSLHRGVNLLGWAYYVCLAKGVLLIATAGIIVYVLAQKASDSYSYDTV